MAEPVFVESSSYWNGGADDLLELLRRPPWMARGACRRHPEVNFFPTQGEDSRPAKAVCAGCPVQAQCREYSRNERFGVWAGTSERERRQARRDTAA